MIATTEPHWLEEQELEDILQMVIVANGGLAGIRDQGMLASALAAVQPLWSYAPEPPSLVDLAARLANGLAKKHGFMVSNKRTDFIAAYAFWAMNGVVIQASQQSVVEAMEALAYSTEQPGRTQERLTVWLRSVSEATVQEQP